MKPTMLEIAVARVKVETLFGLFKPGDERGTTFPEAMRTICCALDDANDRADAAEARANVRRHPIIEGDL